MRTFKSIALAFALLAAPVVFAAASTTMDCPVEKCTKEEAAKCPASKDCPKDCTKEDAARCAKSANAKKPAAPAPKADKS